MKTKSLLPLIAVALATAISRGAPADDVNAAAKKLADAPNYSWTTTTENAGGGGGRGGGRGGFGGGPMSGKTEKGGYTLTSRKFQDNEIQTLRKGDQFATQNFQSGEWMSAEEMRQQMANFGGGQGGQGGGQRGGQGGGRGGRGGLFGNQTNPAEEAVALAGEAKDLKAEGDAIVGALSSEAVGPRLFGGFGGRGGGGGAPAPQNASGTVKFWVKDGVLSKYELHVKGSIEGPNGEFQIDRTTTTEIKDVGSTKVSPPEAAVKKLGA